MRILYLSVLALILSSCGGGGGSGTSTPNPNLSSSLVSTNLNGVAMDGYLYNAEVFIDLDGDGEKDADEFSTVTDENGSYTLPLIVDDPTAYSVVVRAIPGQTIDQDDPSTPITEAFSLMAPPGYNAVISPVTTEVYARMSDGTSIDDAISDMKSDYGFSNNMNLMSDYIQNKGNDNTYQQLHNIATAINEVLKVVGSDDSLSGGTLASKLNSIKNNVNSLVIANANQIKSQTTTQGAKSTVKSTDNWGVELRIDPLDVMVGSPATVKSRIASLIKIDPSKIASNTCNFSGGNATEVQTGVYTVTFDTEGMYTVQCTITLDDNTSKQSREYTIVVRDLAPRNVSIQKTSSSVNLGDVITFNASATDPRGESLTYAWDFGDGNTGSGTQVDHIYQTEGTFTVTLTVTNTSGHSASQTSTITVSSLPVPSNIQITPSAQAVTLGESIDFTVTADDESGGSLTYGWEFGDGNTGSGASVSHTYAASGTYDVTVTVTNSVGGSATESISINVSDVPVPTGVAINASSLTVIEGTSIDFTGSATDSTFTSLTYSWDFGDGTTGSGESVSHTFTQSGTYTLTLTVTNGLGGFATHTIDITVDGEPVPGTPVINASTLSTFIGDDPIDFSVTATDPSGSALTFTWDFGDGNTGTGESVSHTYSSTGSYTVMVTATNTYTRTSTASVDITVTSTPTPNNPVITPSVTTTFVGAGAIDFTVSGSDPSGSTLTYTWDFGDGNTGTGESVSHTYSSAGTYTVVVTATNTYNQTATAAVDITVNDEPTPTDPTINASKTVAAPNDTITFTASSTDPSGSTLTYNWDFGDTNTATGESVTHAYTAEGDYTVTVTVSNTYSNTASATLSISIQSNVFDNISTCQDTFAPACMGEHCSAQDHQTLSGLGYGIWCYHNSTSSPVDIDISIDGVDNARMASLVFTNGTNTDLSSLPDVGDLAIQTTHPQNFEPADHDHSHEILNSIHAHNDKEHSHAVNYEITERNIRQFEEMRRIEQKRINGDPLPDKTRIFYDSHTSEHATFGDRTGQDIVIDSTQITVKEAYQAGHAPSYDQVDCDNDQYCITYDAIARGMCTISSGRRVVFWMQSEPVVESDGSSTSVGEARSNGSQDGVYGNGSMFTSIKPYCTDENNVVTGFNCPEDTPQITPADLQVMMDTVCSGSGQGGAFDILNAELGEFWLDATDHPGTSYILPQESDEHLLDLNIFFFAPTDCISSSTNDTAAGCNSGYGGYFNSGTLFYQTLSGTENDALFFFMDAAARAGNPAGSTHTIIHEATHMLSYVNAYRYGKASNLQTWLEETIAESLEDFVLQGNVVNSFNYTESDEFDVTGHGYVTYCHSNSYYGLIEWSGSSTNCSYSLGSTFGSFMNRRYPSDWFIQAHQTCGLNDTNFEHWACLDGIIKGLGGHSIDDEFARFAASVYTIDESNGDMWFCNRGGSYEGRCVGVGILSTGIPQGFGYPARNDFTPPMQGLRLNLDVTERKNHAPLTTFKKSSNWFQRHYLYGSDGNSLGTNFSTNGLTIPENTTFTLIIK